MYTFTLILTLLQKNLSLENVLDSLIFPSIFSLVPTSILLYPVPKFSKKISKSLFPHINLVLEFRDQKWGSPGIEDTVGFTSLSFQAVFGILHRGFANTEKTLWSFFCFRNPFLEMVCEMCQNSLL